MTHLTSCGKQWIHDLQDVKVDFRCFPHIFLVILVICFTYSETNAGNKYMLKINKRHTTVRRGLFSKLTRKQNDATDVVRMSSLLALNTFHTLC